MTAQTVLLTDFLTGPIPRLAFGGYQVCYGKGAISDTILEALASYEQHHGVKANYVKINADDYDEGIVIDGVEIIGVRNVLKGHAYAGRR